jgi:hypothetical protein
MIHLKIIDIDGTAGIVLTERQMERFGAAVGDVLILHEGGFTVASETGVQVAIGKQLIDEHIEVFKAPAKT